MTLQNWYMPGVLCNLEWDRYTQFTVKQNSMNMVQPTTTGLVLPGTGSYKLEWTGVDNADDYVLRIRNLTTGKMVIGDEAGDGVHTGTDTYLSISNTSSI